MHRFSELPSEAVPPLAAVQAVRWLLLLFFLTGVAAQTDGQRHQTAACDPSAGCISLDEYWSLVVATQDLLQGLAEAPLETSSPVLDNIATRWQAVSVIQMPGGELLPVDTRFMAVQLRADPPNVAHLSALIKPLLEARQEWPQGQFTHGDLAALQEILARPEFQWQPQQPSPLQAWWEKLGRFLQRLLSRIFSEIDTLPEFLPTRFLLIGVGLVVIVFVLVYAWRGIRGSLASEVALDLDKGGVEENLTASLALHKAQEMSSSGDYRLAVRYLYLSALLLLEERGLLRYDRSRTNREYLRSLAHLPELAANLREVVEVVDRVWYGYQPLDQAGYERYAAQVARLKENG